MELSITDRRNALFAVTDRLGDRDRSFAMSLLRSASPSEKQLHWIDVLTARVTAPAAEDRSAGQVANVSGIVDLISRGGHALKHPAILFEAGDQQYRLSIAGPRSSAPGSINVTDAVRGGYEGRTWFGRIHKDGRFEPSRKIDDDTAAGILTALQAFAADPAGIAAAFGRRTGCCCFCAKGLTDPVSIEVGYGPVCAHNYGLDHRATGLRPGMRLAA